MKNILVMILPFFLVKLSSAQELSGRVTNSVTGEAVPFASIYLPNVQIGTITDSTGNFYFRASLPDEVSVRISSRFYETQIIIGSRGEFLNVKLQPSHLDIDEVVVIMPSGVMQRDNTVRVDHLDLKDLNAIPASNLIEAIANINGVQQASTGAGISKPVIRGMQGVRVLTVLNGIRIENQQWGSDHGLGISQLGIGAVELIKGPSSLLYGADAFGGVLYLIDEKFTSQNTYEIQAQSKFESATLGTTNSIMLKLSKNNIRFNLAGLYSDFSDMKLSNGKFLRNSRYFDHGIKTRLAYSHKNWSMQARYMYSQSRIGIPGDIHDSILDTADFIVDVQARNSIVPAQFIQNHFFSLENSFYIKKNELNLSIGQTFNDLSEYEDAPAVPALQMKLSNTLYHLKYIARINAEWKIIIGFQGMYQQNSNVEGLEEQLIPNFRQIDNGLYSIAYWDRGGKLGVQFGGRYDIRNLNTPELSKVYASPNFSIGMKYAWNRSKEIRNILRFNISTGFRAPHVSELLSDGEHHGALRYEIGSPNLKSERATQFDLDYEFETEHLSFVINPFYNYIQNYIQIEAQDSIIEGLPLYKYNQTDKMQMYGIDLGVHYHPHFAHWMHLESSYSFIRGESFNGASISLMPQARLNNLLKLKFIQKGKFKIEEFVFQHMYYFDQNRIASFETSSSAYHLIHCGLNFKWEMKNPLEIAVGVKNVLNSTYVNHLSRLKNIGMTEMGRSVYINLRYTFSGALKTKHKVSRL